MISLLRSFDYSLVKLATNWTAAAPWHVFLVYLAAELLIFVFPVVLFFMWRDIDLESHNHGGKKAVVLAIFSVALGLAIKSLVVFVYFRARPLVTYPDLLTMNLRVGDPSSFPSGHTLTVFAAATSILLSGFKKIGWILLGLAVLVGLGRVFAGVHFPTDVIAGAFIGAGSAWFWHLEGNGLKRYLPNH